MLINIKLIRAAFFFLEDLVLTKGSDPTQVDISTKTDSFISVLVNSLVSGVIEADIEASDLVRFIKDLPTRIGLQKAYGLEVDELVVVHKVQEEAIEEAVEIAEVSVAEDEIGVVEDEEEKSERVLEDILLGSNKQVLSKIKDAALSEDEAKTLIALEKDNKNRAIIIAAINEV